MFLRICRATVMAYVFDCGSLGDQHCPVGTVIAVGVIVARNAHLAGFRIEEDGTVAIGIHPGIDDLFRAAAAPGSNFANGLIFHVKGVQHGKAAGAIGTGVGVDLCQLTSAELGSGVQVCTAQNQGVQAAAGALFVDQCHNLLRELVSVHGVVQMTTQ